jgi:glycosyltransferase involved in cell wall biosynthesis
VKLLLTTPSLDPRAGAGMAERTRQLAKHLSLAGAEVRVVAAEGGPIADELRSRGFLIHVTGSVRLRYDVPFIWPGTLMRHVEWADRIHILGYWSVLSIATAFSARARSKPYVLCPAGGFHALSEPSVVKHIFHRTVGRRMIDDAARLVSITELERQEIIARFDRPPDQVVTVPNGAEELDPADQPMPSGMPRGPYVLFIGRLARIKGPDLLLDGFGRIAGDFPEVSLVLAGPDFGLEAELRATAAKPPLGGRVVFTGFLDEGQRTAILRQAECLVVPSRSEAMSLVAGCAGRGYCSLRAGCGGGGRCGRGLRGDGRGYRTRNGATVVRSRAQGKG